MKALESIFCLVNICAMNENALVCEQVDIKISQCNNGKDPKPLGLCLSIWVLKSALTLLRKFIRLVGDISTAKP
jgi:hypothetical protein